MNIYPEAEGIWNVDAMQCHYATTTSQLPESMSPFDIVVVVTFQNVFCLEIQQNNVFFHFWH
jgi:hypothetical protein